MIKIDSDQFETKLQRNFLWLAVLTCLAYVLFLAITKTNAMMAFYNYCLSPLGDDGIDASNVLYPVILGKKGLIALLTHYGDHRLVVGRLQAILEFFYLNGTQAWQGFRLAGLLWMDTILFAYIAVYKNSKLITPYKILIPTAFLSFLFLGLTLGNYGSTYMVTWPLIFFFIECAFICFSNYFESLISHSKKSIFWMVATVFFINCCLYTFGAGMLLWPVVFAVLLRQRTSLKHTVLWTIFAILTYKLYMFDGWSSQVFPRSLKLLVLHPVDFYLYYTRILTEHSIPSSGTASTFASTILGTVIIIISSLFLINLFYTKKNWTKSDTFIFSFLLYNSIIVFTIADARFSTPSETVTSRFTTPSFGVLICLLTLILQQSSEVTINWMNKLIVGLLTVSWLLAIVIKNDVDRRGYIGIYDHSVWNQFLIAEATGIPIDQSFGHQIGLIQNEQDPVALNFLNDVQKQNKKGVYSLFETQFINHNISDLSFTLRSLPLNLDKTINIDFRPENPGVLLRIISTNYPDLSLKNCSSVFFTNTKGIIIGFGLENSIAPLKESFAKYRTLVWTGAINSSLLDTDNIVEIWALNKRQKQLIKLDSMKV